MIGQLDADLAPIQEALTGLDQNLGGITSAGTGLSTGLDQLTARMADINRELAGANELVDQYLATADRAAVVVTDVASGGHCRPAAQRHRPKDCEITVECRAGGRHAS